MNDTSIAVEAKQEDNNYDNFVVKVQERLESLFNQKWSTVYALLEIQNHTQQGNFGDYRDFLSHVGRHLGEEGIENHTCRRCTDFINTLGSILVVYKDGTVEPLFWNVEGDGVFEQIANSIGKGMLEYLQTSHPHIKSVGLSSADILKLKKAGHKHEGGLDDFHIDERAISVLSICARRGDLQELQDIFRFNFQIGFYRNNAKWLRDAKKKLSNRSSLPSSAMDKIVKAVDFYDRCFNYILDEGYSPNVTRAIAESAGLLHARRSGLEVSRLRLNNTTVGNLIQRVQKDVNNAIRMYMDETDTTRYLRSDKASLEVTLEAENYFEENGLNESLQLRFATLDEIREDLSDIWWEEETLPEEPKKGLFSGVVDKLGGEREEKQPLRVEDFMKTSMDQFVREVLPTLTSLTLKPMGTTPVGFITAMKNEDAPCIFKWASDEDGNKRVPYAWAFLNDAHLGNLSRQPIKVKGVIRDPMTQAMGGLKHKYSHVMFILDITELGYSSRGLKNPMFPELLRSDLFKYRRVVESFNKLDDNAFTEDSEHAMVGIHDDKLKTLGFSLLLLGINQDGVEVGYNIVM